MSFSSSDADLWHSDAKNLWGVVRTELSLTSEEVDEQWAELDRRLEQYEAAWLDRGGAGSAGSRFLRAVVAAKGKAAAAAVASAQQEAAVAAAAGDGEGGETLSLQEQLRAALERDHALLDLFRSWDRNGDGRIGKQELRRAVPCDRYTTCPRGRRHSSMARRQQERDDRLPRVAPRLMADTAAARR